MKKTILDYTAKGAQVSLEEAMQAFDNSKKLPDKEKRFNRVSKIYHDLFDLKRLGFPLTDGYMTKVKREYNKRQEQHFEEKSRS